MAQQMMLRSIRLLLENKNFIILKNATLVFFDVRISKTFAKSLILKNVKQLESVNKFIENYQGLIGGSFNVE